MKKYSRSKPYLSWIKERALLTGKSSSKKTFHIVLDTEGWDETFKVGDSIGILPSNDPKEVDAILQKMGCDGKEQVTDPRQNDTLSIRDFLTKRANLSRVNRSFLAQKREDLKGLLENKETLTTFLHTNTLCDLIVVMAPQELAKLVMPLLPRFYSISNSQGMFPNEIHLLVAYVHYQMNGQERYGVGSHFLCDFAETVPIYVQPSNHFSLPLDPASSMIMIGPGTGVAPYRAFLQERISIQATGRHWLFFGERNRKTDFYYESYWTELEKQGRLRLDCAFSRDQEKKEYVSHKMYERKKSLWQWIHEGAFLYVCGDVNEMAKEVDDMIHQIVKEEGGYSEEDAIHFVKKMRHEKRYLLDVY